jgi:DNA-binding transcriptional LysR family regulator
MNPQYLAIFVAIVQAGSISRAASQLGCGKSVISRQLAKLETELNARLIQRSTRRLTLTEIGELVFQEALKINHSLTNVKQITEHFRQEVRGNLRVSCPTSGGSLLIPLISKFLEKYPDVKIDLRLEDRLVDLIGEQYDVAIRAALLADSSLIARKLSDNPYVIVASPAYLTRLGEPLNPSQLQDHRCLVYTRGDHVRDTWIFSDKGKKYKIKINGVMQINDGDALVLAAVAGTGILLIPRYLIVEEILRGELIPILSKYEFPSGPPIYAVYPERSLLPLKTSAFVRFMEAEWGSVFASASVTVTACRAS